MADVIQYSITGADELNAKIKSVTNDLRFKGGRFALRKAANKLREKVEENAKKIDDPETAEEIAKNIAIRWSPKFFKATGDMKFRVGVLGGAGGNLKSNQLDHLPGKDTRHWRHLEFGSEHNRAQPFMRKSLPESINQITNEFVNHYGRSIDRALRRAKK